MPFNIEFTSMLSALHPEQVDALNFRGDSLNLPGPRIFGGQVLAQSLNTAIRTVEADRSPHSLHAYFLRPGDPRKPIEFEVDPIRDGGSFSTRCVVARQDDKAIFNCSVSFQRPEEGLSHQTSMPRDVPPPEALAQDASLLDRGKTSGTHPPRFEMRSYGHREIDAPPTPQDPVQGYWFRFNEDLGGLPHPHQTLLALVSDRRLLSTSLLPHPISIRDPQLMASSLDHSLWFHTDFSVSDWLCFHMESPRLSHGRGFNTGSFYTRQGTLIASTAQEALIRMRRK